MSGNEVFGLPFLFTGGLPNSLEKFTEGNLKCFLIYLIEVVGKANRQNVWQKPIWWQSRLIPYSPISVNTNRVPQEQVVSELRSLIESCYRYYKAEKILQVSKQLAEIPRILLGIKDNGDNTMTIYDNNSKAIYVTVRPENLYYDAQSLNKISKDFKSNYAKEDVSFCKINKTSQYDEEMIIPTVELSDTDSDSEVLHDKRHSLKSRGVVIRSGDNLIIELSDSDGEESGEDAWTQYEEKCDSKKYRSIEKERKPVAARLPHLRPCPKSFKRRPPPRKDKDINLPVHQVIILSDTDDEAPQELNNIGFPPPPSSPARSILGPLSRSPRKDLKSLVGQLKPHLNQKPIRSVAKKKLDSDEGPSSDEDLFKPTKEELYLLKKKDRTFYSVSPKKIIYKEKPQSQPATQGEFLELFGLGNLPETRVKEENKCKRDFETAVRSVVRSFNGSLSRMPLDWLKTISSPNHVILSKRSSRSRNSFRAFKDYEPYCSTNKTFVDYNIKLANKTVGKDRRGLCRQGRRGIEKTGGTVEKWCLQTEEALQRTKRAARRDLIGMSVEESLCVGTLVPLLDPLPHCFLEPALHSSISIKQTFVKKQSAVLLKRPKTE